MESVQKHGLIHPLVVSTIPGSDKLELIAGERRFKACLALGWTEVTCLIRTQVTELDRKEIELEENIRRDDLEWSESVELLRQIDEIKRQVYGSRMPGKTDGKGWTVQNLADLAGKSTAEVSRSVTLAKLMIARPDIKERIKNLPMSAAIKVAQQIQDAEDMKRKVDSGLFELSHDLQLGDARTLIKDLPNESIDLLLTDMPYGIQTLDDEVGGSSPAMSKGAYYTQVMKPADNLNEEECVKLMSELSPELFRVLKPGRHIYIFLSVDIFQFVRQVLTKTGFIIDPCPIIWYKGHATTPFKGYYYSRCYEIILFGHKPPQSRRLNEAKENVIKSKPCDIKSKVHPFQKPRGLLWLLVNQSTYIGETVLDIFAGSGQTLVACRNIGRKCIGFELNEEHFMKAQAMLASPDKEPEETIKDVPRPQKVEVRDFRELKRGTTEFIEYWKTHPEEQVVILAWIKEQES
jgi:ParB/RepB/Spo0J family partition protein